jgi:hypothetical protein
MMASAGVVGMADVIIPNSNTSSRNLAGSCAMWSFIWVGLSALFLVFVNLAMIGRAGR